MDKSRKGAIATFFLDWPFSFVAGLIFGIAGSRESASPLKTRAFRIGLAYLQVGILAIAVALYLLRPDWMLMYWIDASTLPIAVIVLAFALYELCFVAGFAIGHALSARRAWALAIAVGIGATIGEFITRNRLTKFGTYERFHAGLLRPDISTSPSTIGWTLIILLPLSVATLFVLAFRVARRVP